LRELLIIKILIIKCGLKYYKKAIKNYMGARREFREC